MHVGIFGPTRCGKTTLAQSLATEYARTGRACLVCDPIGIRWAGAHWQTTTAAQLLAKAQASRNCCLFMEEASLSIARDRSLSWLFTTAGNPNAGGHLTHIIGQDGSSLLPAMRQQLATIYLFRCHPDLAQTWAKQFAEPSIAEIAPNLSRYEFLIVRAYEKPRRCILKTSTTPTIAAPTGAPGLPPAAAPTSANVAPSP
jgi:hypothetical protein